MSSKSHPVGSRDYLEDLLGKEPSFQFTSVDNLERTVQRFEDQGQSQYLSFRGVPEDVFLELGTNRSSILYCCRYLYIHGTQSVRIRMPSEAHGTAVGEFSQRLIVKLTRMGSSDDITSRHSGLRNMGSVSKEPDGSWGPLVPQRYVTCILEVGMSESQHKLLLDARLWLELPESPKCHIHQVITIKIHQDQPRIVLQKWEQSRREYGGTRSSHPREALKTEEVEVSLVNNIAVATGSLRLSFAKIFERPPAAGTLEDDVIFSPEDLIAIAREVWIAQKMVV